METRAGDLWLSSATAVFRVHQGKAERFEKERDLIESGGTCFAEDREGNVWMACYGGINIWRQGRWEHLLTATNTFPYGVFALAADREGAVWIGTKRNQLSCYQNGTLTSFPLNADTTDNAICGILDDGDGNLWMTTFRGLMRVRKSAYAECVAGSRRDLDADLFGPEDGLVENSSYGPASPTLVRDANGRIHAATLRGLVSFDPKQVLPNLRPPAARIEEVQLDRRSIRVQPGRAIRVPPGVNQVEIRYTGVQLSQPGKVRFRYRLDGVDTTWVEAGGRRTAYYPRLPHGVHLLQVQAAGPDRAWPDASTTLTLEVGAFFWETRWFTLSLILGGTALIAWLVRYMSTRSLELRLAVAQHQAAVERERARISRDMHDDLGARLTKIAFYTELAERDADSKGSREHLHSVARMSREAAQALDEMVWAVKPTNDTLANLANYLCQYATEYLAETPIRLRLDLPVSIAPRPVPAEVRHQVFLVLKEALNNVVKHAEAHEVLLQMKPGGQDFTIALADDGIGIRVDPTLGSPTGNGLQNMHQRIHQVGGTFAIGPRPGGGTEIRLVVPLRTEPAAH
jgi:signal transduction histidine kinase